MFIIPIDYHINPIKLHLPFMRIMNPIIINGLPVFDNLALIENKEDINVENF